MKKKNGKESSNNAEVEETKALQLQCQLNKPNWHCSNCSKLKKKKKKRKKDKDKGNSINQNIVH